VYGDTKEMEAAVTITPVMVKNKNGKLSHSMKRIGGVEA
jgi:hypothetical protein